MILDHADALREFPLAPEEVVFCCADRGPDGFLVLLGMGFGGRAFPFAVGRAPSFVGRASQAMLHPYAARRLQAYVDDPIQSVRDSFSLTQAVFDATILLWLLLGVNLSLEKKVL